MCSCTEFRCFTASYLKTLAYVASESYDIGAGYKGKSVSVVQNRSLLVFQRPDPDEILGPAHVFYCPDFFAH